jgi:hypothetical protein
MAMWRVQVLSSNGTSGATLGPHKVNVEVANGRGGTADCSAEIRVESQPNRPPTIRCPSDRRSISAGETVAITAIARDPDNDPLSFSWNASGGKLEGSGSSVKVLTAGYEVNNGRISWLVITSVCLADSESFGEASRGCWFGLE